ncbi:putative outer envelope membrane protein [Helianthus annuus]|uniref:Outer envelope membrane protein n=1 Tax=Helianthus annuus TaxID=4232 RepID=A0A9K3I4F4_HELAN|nr:putative outer envelope membrane protein [Helianthus annuus]KAJ0533083.1 putative outer envelope membrane protein [Helianthus annuus]KAJ0887085.1 putative outer envelope membrane protein [Helianthus annuus]KAJ0892049.1 putative outer envelope membrane protein [Helianthus annuus]
MKEAAKNGLRSGLVVIGALAFGYLTLQLGFKPYLEKAQQYNSATGTTDSNGNDLNRQMDQHDQYDQVTVNDVVLDDGSGS